MIIAFCGKMGAGKDTMYSYLEKNRNDVVRFAFADSLRDEVDSFICDVKDLGEKINERNELARLAEKHKLGAKDLNRLLPLAEKSISDNMLSSRKRSPEIRQMLQYWGTELRRADNPNYWTDIAQEFFNKNKDKTICVTDARFENELELLSLNKATTVFLDASEKTRIDRIEKRDGITPSRESMQHSSERFLGECLVLGTFKFSHVVDNNNETPDETWEKIEKLI